MEKLKKKISALVVRISLFALILAVPQKSFAYDEMSKAFGDFIEALYNSTQTTNRENLICLYGSDDVASYLVFKEKIKVIKEDDQLTVKSIANCRVIYVAKSRERFVKSFVGAFNQSGAINVATFESFVDNGGMIFIDLGRRDFELTVNAKAFKASGAKLDSAIAALIINNK